MADGQERISERISTAVRLSPEEIVTAQAEAQQLKEDGDIEGAIVKYEEILPSLEKAHKLELRLLLVELCQKIISDADVDQGKKQTFYVSLLKHTKAYMIQKDSKEEKKQEMNEEGERLFLQLELDIESHTRKERLRILEGMKKNSTKHFSEFHMRLLFKVAKLLLDESMVQDESDEAGINIALNLLKKARQCYQQVYDFENNENIENPHSSQLAGLKKEIDLNSNTLDARLGLIKAANFHKEFDETEEEEKRAYLGDQALDAVTNAQRGAEASGNMTLQSLVWASLGNTFYKYRVVSDENRFQNLERAEQAYKQMQEMARLIFDESSVLNEDWFTAAKKNQTEIQKEIIQLQRKNMSEEEKKAHDEANAAIEQAKTNYTNMSQNEFVEWLLTTYVHPLLEENKRKPMPPQETLDNDKKYARWYVPNITKHIHPDKFMSDSKPKQILMSEISILSNKILNKLKGHA